MEYAPLAVLLGPCSPWGHSRGKARSPHCVSLARSSILCMRLDRIKLHKFAQMGKSVSGKLFWLEYFIKNTQTQLLCHILKYANTINYPVKHGHDYCIKPEEEVPSWVGFQWSYGVKSVLEFLRHQYLRKHGFLKETLRTLGEKVSLGNLRET